MFRCVALDFENAQRHAIRLTCLIGQRATRKRFVILFSSTVLLSFLFFFCFFCQSVLSLSEKHEAIQCWRKCQVNGDVLIIEILPLANCGRRYKWKKLKIKVDGQDFIEFLNSSAVQPRLQRKKVNKLTNGRLSNTAVQRFTEDIDNIFCFDSQDSVVCCNGTRQIRTG